MLLLGRCDKKAIAECQRKGLPLRRQVGMYKYLLVAEGIAGADRLLQLLGANALILLVQPWTVEEFWQERRHIGITS